MRYESDFYKRKKKKSRRLVVESRYVQFKFILTQDPYQNILSCVYFHPYFFSLYWLPNKSQKLVEKVVAMATLQRSSKSFRRLGSSGSVWDEKLLAELEAEVKKTEVNHRRRDNNNNNGDENGASNNSTAAADDGNSYNSHLYIRSFSVPQYVGFKKKKPPLPPK